MRQIDSFSELHSLAYSYVGAQTLYLAISFPSVYWNTACLIVDSGLPIDDGEEDDSDEFLEDGDEDYNLEEEIDVDLIVTVNPKGTKKAKSTDYGKLAKAMNDILSKGISISAPDINISNYNFEPNEEKNEITFGLSCVTRVGKKVVDEIVSGRPYSSLQDFSSRVKVNKAAMINLIKSGAFDNLHPDKSRKLIMGIYIAEKAGLKKSLNLQNINALITRGLVPEELEMSSRVYMFTKTLKKYFKKGIMYDLSNDSVFEFFSQNLDCDYIETIEGVPMISQKIYEKKIYTPYMDKFRAWLKSDMQNILKSYNKSLFDEVWNKDCLGNISSWEMDSISLYYHEHELINLDKTFYDITDFKDLPEQPEVEYFFKKKGVSIPIYKLSLIVGTIIARDKTKSTLTILTPDKSVVSVRFRKEQFALYDKQISTRDQYGKKTVLEKTWFKKGNKIMLTGIRMDEQFVPKTYSKTKTRSLYLITDVDEKGRMTLRTERINVEN